MTSITDRRTLSAPAQALLGSDAVAHVWTCNADGSPQVSVVWVLVQGDEVLFGCDSSSRKAQNLRRDPSIVLSIQDEVRTLNGYQRHLIVRGTAVLDDGPRPELMDRLASTYVGLARHPLALRDAPSSVVVRVRIDRISGLGPWIDDAS